MDVSRKTVAVLGLSPARTVAIIVALAVGWMLLQVDRNILYPMLPVIGEEFGLSGTQRGAIASVYFFVYVALQIPSGILADRIGLKRVLVGMCLVAGVGLIAVGLLSVNYLALVFFVALHAFGAGAYYSCSYGITISSVPPGRRGIASAVVTSGMATGVAIGQAVSGVLRDALGSWRGPFLVASVPTMLMALVFLPVLKVVTPVPVARGGLLRLFKNRQLLTLSAAGFFLIYGQWVMLTWGPSFLFKERGLSLNQAGLYTALVAIPSIAGALLWGRLSDRIGRRRMLLLVAPFAAFAIFGVAFFGSLKLLLLFLVIYGFTGSLAINPMMVAWAGDIATGSKGIGLASVIGVLNAISVGGSIVAPVISGWILDLTGSLAPAFYVASGCVVTGTLLCFLTREGQRATA